MKSLVLVENKKLHFRDVEMPIVTSANPVLVKVKYAGICGSDIPRGFHGKAYHYPLVMGHEFSGVVEDASESSSFPRGARVAVYPLIPCGTCTSCQTGNYAQCLNYDYYGSRRDGGFSEYVTVPVMNLFPVPDHVDLNSAAMTEPCAVALHGVEKLDIQAGMSGLVIGGGPIGNMAAQWMKLKGCDPVYIADIDGEKLKIAEQLGLKTVNSKKIDFVNEMKKAGASGGIDCVVEACGFSSTFVQAIQCAGMFGQVVFMGNIHGEFKIEEKEFSNILRNELTIKGTWNSKVTPRGKDEWTRVLSFINRGIYVEPLISHTPDLAEGKEIFDRVLAADEWFNKVIFSV